MRLTYLLVQSGGGILQSDHLDQKYQVLNKSQVLYLYQDINDASANPAGTRENEKTAVKRMEAEFHSLSSEQFLLREAVSVWDITLSS